MPKSITPVRMWMLVSLVAAVVAIALIGVSVHLKITEQSCAEEVADFDQYRYFFRTLEEQSEIERTGTMCTLRHKAFNQQMTTQNTQIIDDKVYLACELDPRILIVPEAEDLCKIVRHLGVNVPRLSRDIVYHACCNTTTKFIAPRSAITIYGANVTVIQNRKAGYQFFTIDTCTQMPDCMCPCRCQPVEGIVSAYVRYPPPSNAMNVSQIKLDVCCKCLNIRG